MIKLPQDDGEKLDVDVSYWLVYLELELKAFK